MTVAIQALPGTTVSFERLVLRVADRHGPKAAAAWTKAVLGHQAQINETALRSAIASKNLDSIAAVVGPSGLQSKLAQAITPPLTHTAQAVGKGSTALLASKGMAGTFNAVHPNVILFAREQAAEMVVGVTKQTKQVIAEVIALGAERGLTTADQARAIREVVGLPPNWAHAPRGLEDELRTGKIASATKRRLSAVDKQRIRSRALHGTLTESFIQKMKTRYTASLINARALTIARTETIRAAHAGLMESWDQARAQGLLPAQTRRQWIVTFDDRLCPICMRIPGMNPKGRGLKESFMTPEGAVMAPPAVHPDCRCTLGLMFGDSSPIQAGLPPAGRLRVDSDPFGGFAKAIPRPKVRKLTKAETSALDDYRGNGFEDINGVLRTGKLPKAGRTPPELTTRLTEVRAEIKHLDSAIEATPGVAQDTVVWRGVRNLDLKQGQVFRDAAFVSTTTDPVVAASFTNVSGSTEMSIMRLGLRKGQKALRMSSSLEEKEFLLGRNLQYHVVRTRELTAVEYQAEFKVTRVPRTLQKVTVHDVEVLPPGAKMRLRTGVDQSVPATPAELKRIVNQAANEAGISRRHIKLIDSQRRVTSGAMQGFVLGEYKNGRIVLYTRGQSAQKIRETIAHEAVHLKMAVARTTSDKLVDSIFSQYNILRREDGITEYSKAHWKAFDKYARANGAEFAQLRFGLTPVEETLAEMRAVAAATGRTPGTARYKKLLASIEKGYQKGMRARGGASRFRVALKEEDPFLGYAEGQHPVERAIKSPQISALTNEELAAARNYVGGSRDLNTGLRRGWEHPDINYLSPDEIDRLKKRAELLESAIDKAPGTTKPVVVWRGGAKRWIPEPGTKFRDNGFASTSSRFEKAYDFSEGGPDATVLRIGLPSGQKGLWMPKVVKGSSLSKLEREYLLPRGTEFRVLRKYKEERIPGQGRSPRSVTIIDIEVVTAEPRAVIAPRVRTPGVRLPKKTLDRETLEAVMAKLRAGETSLLAQSKLLGYSNNDPLRKALKAMFGETEYNKAIAVIKGKKFPQLPTPGEILSSIDEVDFLTKKISGPGGSNPGGVYEGSDGVQRYVKFYEDGFQSANEAVANAVYKELGLNAPVSEAFMHNGKLAHAARIIKDVKGTVGELGLTKQTADKILDGFVADVFTANWDAVGLNLDNVLVLKNGNIVRVDQGGSLFFRAQKSKLKDPAVLDQLSEITGFSTKNPSYASVFKKAGVTPDDVVFKERMVDQIDRVLTLDASYAGDWSVFVNKSLPSDVSSIQRKKLAVLLEKRVKLLREYQIQLMDDLNSAAF